MDLSNIAGQVGAFFGLQPATMVLLIFIVTTAANAASRLIPADATGALGVIGKICAFIGVHVDNRITAGVKSSDVSRASMETPPIPAKAEAIAKSDG